VRAEESSLGDDPIDQIFDRVDDVVDVTTDKLIGGLGHLLERLIDRATAPRVPRPPHPMRAARPQPEAPPANRPRPAPTIEDPREILGFEPGVRLTREMVKIRQRKMMTVLHPDAGGSSRAAQRVNEAAKRLLATL